MFKRYNMGSYFNLGKVISALFYTSMLITLFLRKNNSFSLDQFDKRIISQGTIDGVDINARITLFYQSVILSLISFAVFYFLLAFSEGLLRKRMNEKANNYFAFLQNFFSVLSLIGIINILFGLFGTEFKITISFILCFQIFILLVAVLKYFANRFSLQSIDLFLSNKYFTMWLFLHSFVFMYYIEYFGRLFSVFHASHLARNYIIGFIVNFILYYFVFLFLTRSGKTSETKVFSLITIFSIPVFISPIYLPFTNELYLILNQHGIFELTQRKILLIFLLFTILAMVLIYWFNRSKKEIWTIDRVLGGFYYPFLLITFVAVLFQPAVAIGPPGELFESGNPGVTIDQFFRYGKIPLLENFNAHVLSELYAPFIFSIINGYEKWGSFLYNNFLDNLIYVIVGYFFLRKLLSNELAFLTLAFFPLGVLTNLIMPQYYSVGLLAGLVLFKVIKSPGFKNYLIFCFGLFFTFLWRFDIGSSAIPAAIIALFVFGFIYKRKLNIKSLILAGITTGVFWLLAFVVFAVIKHVPIIFRLKELMSVVSSNQVWGLSSLGDSSKLSFHLFYFLTPAIIVLGIGYLLVKAKFFEKGKPEVFVSIFFLLLFTIFNLPRGLVRHSLAENTSLFIVSFLGLSLCCIPLLNESKKIVFANFLKFSAIVFLYTFTVNSYNTSSNFSDNSLLGKTVEHFANFTDYVPVNKNIARYVEPSEYSLQVYQGLKDLFDKTMIPKDTFIDFSNSPLLYVYTDREAPMYINQVPAYLSDEVTQKAFLKEVQNYSVPYVIFSAQRGISGIDGVPSEIRSYRVAEYIYNHYVPFTSLNGYDVWVSKDKKGEIQSKLNKLGQNVKEISFFHPDLIDTSKMAMLGLNQIQATKTGIVLETGSDDPQISGFFKMAGMKELPLKNNAEYELEIAYSTKNPGQTQIYFQLNNEPFSDANSIRLKSSGSKPTEIEKMNIPFSGMLQDIRIDPPSNNTFVLQSLKLKVKTNVYKKLKMSVQNKKVDIGWVPFLWGEKDTLHAVEKAQIEERLTENIQKGTAWSYQINNSIDKKKGNYVHLRVKSLDSTGDAYNGTLQCGVNSKTNGSYTFKIKADGKYHDYLIRVSSEYDWYRLPINTIRFSTERDSEIKAASILKGN